jgi:hypothetical protein
MTNLINSIPEKKSNIPNRTHPFHLVDPSSLPILVSFCTLSLMVNFVLYLHPTYFLISNAFNYFLMSFLILVFLIFV